MIEVSLCGAKNTYRAMPAKPTKLVLLKQRGKFEKLGEVLGLTPFVVKVRTKEAELSIFPSGKLLLKFEALPPKEEAARLAEEIYRIIV